MTGQPVDTHAGPGFAGRSSTSVLRPTAVTVAAIAQPPHSRLDESRNSLA